MKVVINGKAHLQGMSKKTGKPYNFIQVHYNGPARGVEGLASLTLMLNPDEYPLETIRVGRTYDVEFDNRGYPVTFALLPEVK